MRDARALAGPRIAVIGPGTARALRERGIEPDVVPERPVAESLVEALAQVPVTRALIARAEDARDVLPDALRERGAEVDVLALYRTVAEPLDEAQRSAALGATTRRSPSASSARFFAQAAGTLDGPRIASIGPVTSEALRELGREPDIEADRTRRTGSSTRCSPTFRPRRRAVEAAAPLPRRLEESRRGLRRPS